MSVRRAANLAAARRRMPRAVSVTPDSEAHAAEMRRRAEALAVRFGFCTACGDHVDEAHGELHDPWCPVVPPERRRPRG